MRIYCCAAIIGLAMTAGCAVAQTPAPDNAHTLVPPVTPDPGPAGQVVQFPLGTSGGNATMVPNGVDHRLPTARPVYWDSIGEGAGIFG